MKFGTIHSPVAGLLSGESSNPEEESYLTHDVDVSSFDATKFEELVMMDLSGVKVFG